jgi:hypothetical protein
MTTAATQQLETLEHTDIKKHRKILKTLGLMETNLRHPGLNTHKYKSFKGPFGQELFESYVESKTPAAFRIFWCYGPQPGQLTVLSIIPHP